jgi:Sec-independent protein translocase protein TatA
MAKAKLPVKKRKQTRASKKLAQSRAVQEKTVADRQLAEIGKLTAALEQSKAKESKLEVIVKEQGKTIKGLRKMIDEQKSDNEKLAAQVPKKQTKPWMQQKSSLEIPGNMFQITKKGSNEKYPDSLFPVGEILKGEIDSDATIEDIKEYVKSEFGKGTYKIKAFNEDSGYKQLRGSVRFTV